MRKSGVLRRVAILAAFAWGYSHFVLENGQFHWSPEVRGWLHWLLYGAVGWGVTTLFADRFAVRGHPEEPRRHDNNPS